MSIKILRANQLHYRTQLGNGSEASYRGLYRDVADRVFSRLRSGLVSGTSRGGGEKENFGKLYVRGEYIPRKVGNSI